MIFYRLFDSMFDSTFTDPTHPDRLRPLRGADGAVDGEGRREDVRLGRVRRLARPLEEGPQRRLAVEALDVPEGVHLTKGETFSSVHHFKI